LRELQNTCVVHVIPSEAEGYGHVIGEAMSCGVVVVTTDAPPMNELVSAERGVLVRVERSEPMRQGTRYFVDRNDLESRLRSVFEMSPGERERLAINARAWFLDQDRRFERSLREFLEEVAQQAGSGTLNPRRRR
jgi:glycosyltransferase involved in cell wall biosynthesis